MDYKSLIALPLKRFSVPKEQSLRRVMRSFTIAEKAVFYFFVSAFILSGLLLLWQVNMSFMIEVPTRGGTLTEGMVGNPRFINPVLAVSDADKNLSTLVYSGLVRVTPEGEIVNDLAREIQISEDHLTYTAIIHEDATFHDGRGVTADDVIFTIQKISDPLIKSPRRGNWDGVTVEKVDEQTVSFTLKQPYNPFIYNLTTGILPRHIWRNVSEDEFSFSQFNTLPIGSGPFKVDRVERNSGGIPSFYKLIPFEDSLGGAPYLKSLIFRFYPSETLLIEAYNDRVIEGISGISPEKLSLLKNGGSRIISSPLPRIFGVFFNQNQSKVLLNKEVRRALDLASPKEDLIESVFGGYASAVDGPMPAGIYAWADLDRESLDRGLRIEEARAILERDGWKFNEETRVLEKTEGSAKIPLSFSISTGDVPELRLVADNIAAAWRELGAEISVLIFETGDLNQNVIRPRNFDALLFGKVVGRDGDLYPFWHSSQRNDPGLNVALYANNRADKLLDDARSAANREIAEKNYQDFIEEVKSDIPASFLYTPHFIYVVPKKVKAISLGSLANSQDRFLGIRDWYIETDRVWKIFSN